jgi:hypothetical protein
MKGYVDRWKAAFRGGRAAILHFDICNLIFALPFDEKGRV